MDSSAKRLIVNADDFGMSPGVNRGVLDSHLRGIVTSTSVMVNMPDTDAAIAAADQDAPNLGLGLHLNLTHGRPIEKLARVTSLVDGDGCFRAAPLWVGEPETLRPEEVREELAAQFDRFVELTDRFPDHLDSHHFITFFNVHAFGAMLDLAECHGIPIRNPHPFLDQGRISEFCADIRAQNNGNGPTEDDIAGLAERLRTLSDNHPRVGRPAAFDRRFYGSGATIEQLVATLDTLGPGLTELMCHPGYATDPLDDDYREQRERELSVLTDHRVRAALERNRISLTSYARWR